MKALGIGVVGTGFAGAAHVDALRRVPGARLAAVAASTAQRADDAARRLGAERAYGDWRTLVDDPAVDVVHDCAPNDLHADVNRAVLEAGKHLLSEKPLGFDARETAALAEHASAVDVVSGVCFNYRHFPLVRELRTRVRDDGPPHAVRGGYLQDWLLEATDWNWRLDPARGGSSRAVGDIGSHWLDLATYVTGDRIVAVCSELGRLHEQRSRPAAHEQTFARGTDRHSEPVSVATEDFAHVLLRFESGASGLMAVSQVTAGRKNQLRLEVDLARASYAWDQEEPNRLWIGRRDAPNAELPRDPTLLGPEAARLAHYPAGHQEGWPDALRNLIADFYAAVRAHDAGKPHEPSFAGFDDAHRTMILVEAIVESGRAGGWVTIEERTEVSA